MHNTERDAHRHTEPEKKKEMRDSEWSNRALSHMCLESPLVLVLPRMKGGRKAEENGIISQQ